MNESRVLAIVQEHSDYMSVWYPEIPSDEPLLVALFEKYRDSGCSVAGTKEDTLADLEENL